jgi:Spy/CpxP family protein refolding chaperone
MSKNPGFRRGGWALVGALAVAATLLGGAAAPAAAGAVPTTAFAADGTPAKRQALTPAERAHIREIRRNGRERGLTDAQIRAEIESYLRSLKREKHVK